MHSRVRPLSSRIIVALAVGVAINTCFFSLDTAAQPTTPIDTLSLANACELTTLGISTPQSAEHIRFESSHLEEHTWTNGRLGGSVTIAKRKMTTVTSKSGTKRTAPAAWDDYSRQPDISGHIFYASEFLPEGLRGLFTIDAYNKKMEPVAPGASTRYVSIPDRSEINGGMTILENALSTPDHKVELIKFYDHKESLSALTYVQRFALEGLLPMGTNGDMREHDFNYHFLSSLFMPEELIKAMRGRAKLVMDFYQFVQDNARYYTTSPGTAVTLRKRVMPAAAHTIDLSANFAYEIWTPEGNLASEGGVDNLRAMFYDARTPLEYFKRLIANSVPEPGRDFKQMYDDFIKELPEDLNQQDLPEVWLTDHQAFLDALSVQHARLDAAARAHLHSPH